jgi:hypothetical protein
MVGAAGRGGAMGLGGGGMGCGGGGTEDAGTPPPAPPPEGGVAGGGGRGSNGRFVGVFAIFIVSYRDQVDYTPPAPPDRH